MQVVSIKVLEFLELVSISLLVNTAIIQNIKKYKLNFYFSQTCVNITFLLILDTIFQTNIIYSIFHKSLIEILMITNLIYISLIDMKYFKIPNSLLLMDLVLFMLHVISTFEDQIDLLLSSSFSLITIILSLIFSYFYKNKIGFGDIKMIALSYYWIDIYYIDKFFLTISFVGLTFLLLKKKKGQLTKIVIPLAPAISIARLLCLK